MLCHQICKIYWNEMAMNLIRKFCKVAYFQKLFLKLLQALSNIVKCLLVPLRVIVSIFSGTKGLIFVIVIFCDHFI